MKIGDLVRHKPETIAKGGIQKQGLVMKVEAREYNSRPEWCVLGFWDYPGVGLRWIPVRWLEVISEGR